LTTPIVDRTSGFSGHLFDPYVASATKGNVKQSSFVISAALVGGAKTEALAKCLDRILAAIETAQRTTLETSAYAAMLALEQLGLKALPSPDTVYQLSYTLNDAGDLAVDLGYGDPDEWRHGQKVGAAT
jgi:hypothetical protein